MPDEVLTTREVAELLRSSLSTVYSWCKTGKLPAFKIGQQWRVRRRDLEREMRRLMEKKA